MRVAGQKSGAMLQSRRIDDRVGCRELVRRREFGWQHRTRPRVIDAIRSASQLPERTQVDLSKAELEVLALIAYRQPISRERLSELAGRAISRDTLAWLKQQDLITTGPRLAQPGAPATYVMTLQFLERFGLNTIGDLPEMDDGSVTAAV